MMNDASTVEDSEPEDVEEFRRSLIRKMNDVSKEWRSCREPICRRAKACVAQSLVCVSRLPKLTPEQHARAGVDLHRALQKRVAELGGREAVEASVLAEEQTAHGEESTKGQAASSHKRGTARTNPADAKKPRTRGRGRK